MTEAIKKMFTPNPADFNDVVNAVNNKGSSSALNDLQTPPREGIPELVNSLVVRVEGEHITSKESK